MDVSAPISTAEETAQTEAKARPTHAALRGRFWLACALAVPANLIWNVWTLSVNPAGPWFDECPLLANVVVFLLALAGLNALFRRYRPAWMLSQTELLLLYTVLAISTAVGGSCYGQALGVVIGYPYWFGHPGRPGNPGFIPPNDWSAFIRHLPQWLIVSDKEVLKGFWEGNSSAYRLSVLQAWAPPLLAWSAFIMVLFVLAMCINVLVRAHWVRAERLTFPIVWLPVEMTRPSGELFRSRLMWIGFVPAFASQILNGLNYFYPWLPYIPTKFQSVQQLLPNPPWNAMNNLTVALHPLMIGLGYLLPQDLLFSSWFFHFFWQGERIMAAGAGYSPAEQASRFPYITDQAFGGFLALGVLAVWGSRRHLAAAWARARRRPSAADDSTEAISYRAAFAGVVVCLGIALAFMVASGMSLTTAFSVLSLLTVMLLAITRLRAESGGPLHDMVYLGPALTMTKLAGTRAFSPQDLTAMSLHQWYVEYGFNQPQPYGLEALKMAEESRGSQRRFFTASVAAALIGMVGTLVVEMHFAYTLGEAAKFDKTGWGQTSTWNRLNNWFALPTGPNAGSLTGVAFGAAATVFLAIMRTRYVGWPFHPVPYPITAGIGGYVGFFWMPFLIAWMAKVFIIRYWGRPGFRQALPFFLGLIIGEMTGGMLWPLYGMLTGKQCYSFFGA